MKGFLYFIGIILTFLVSSEAGSCATSTSAYCNDIFNGYGGFPTRYDAASPDACRNLCDTTTYTDGGGTHTCVSYQFDSSKAGV